jgi:ornithine cyclodeaminase/alanine dehydrogenase-like protein (mu-crystallin family)
MAFNLGIALEDVATAAHCLRLARERAVGTALAP